MYSFQDDISCQPHSSDPIQLNVAAGFFLYNVPECFQLGASWSSHLRSRAWWVNGLQGSGHTFPSTQLWSQVEGGWGRQAAKKETRPHPTGNKHGTHYTRR